ncbi:glycine cleavage system aminomethyltransferase GcvT [Polynucleobacter sp. MWH-Loch1C5]|uniref:glycine cleavage system aminomethyltransferase GcvT n=1 Tax=Polynucleobacter sp. MWH-Loch1C5 TaxID=2689108 RepID=UPI001C0D3427|nr:glycine cleavage system aminomethyltransferase GcvT [Polynucleobacter sp. MWH-Loch1C5]MBU3542443.1 glycine cleavage system aminomethyltransferase GcvT [Polynucleobacter sp. MWH-Loch1C5]
MSVAPSQLKRTILFPAHEELQARLVDFGGWEMPVNYGSQIEEHLATRQHCGMFDVSHMAAVDVLGENANSFLEYALANNINKLADGQALYSCMLNESGGVIDDLIVYRFGKSYRLVINASTAANDLMHLQTVANKFPGTQLVPRRPDLLGAQDSCGMIAVQGPQALALIGKTIPELNQACQTLKVFFAEKVNTSFGEIMIGRTGYTGEDGAELLIPIQSTVAVWNALLKAGARPAGLGARDTLRLEAGMNLYGQDMNEQTSPKDVGLSWTLDLKSARDFIGKHALMSSPQQYVFLGLVLQDKGVLRSHQVVKTSLGDGEITSGTYSPSMQQSIALAKLPVGIQVNDSVKVVIRDKELSATVVKPPFVRHGKVLV